MSRDLLVKIYRANTCDKDVKNLSSVVVRIDDFFLADEDDREDFLYDVTKFERIFGFRVLPVTEKPEDIKEYNYMDLTFDHISEKDFYQNTAFRNEDFYPMCYFSTQHRKHILPTNECMTANGVCVKLRPYDYVFDVKTGKCTFGKSRLDELFKLPAAEILVQRANAPVKRSRHNTKTKEVHPYEDDATKGNILHFFGKQKTR